jgi:hypothetical protein
LLRSELQPWCFFGSLYTISSNLIAKIGSPEMPLNLI